MKDSEDVQRLIRLKRYETPGEDYFKQFAEDFKERQRSEMLQQSSRAILAERVSLWLDEMAGTKWMIPTGAAAAAALGAGVFFATAGSNENASETLPLVETKASISDALPEFPEAKEGVIHLQLPKAKSAGAPEVYSSNQVLPAGLREL